MQRGAEADLPRTRKPTLVQARVGMTCLPFGLLSPKQRDARRKLRNPLVCSPHHYAALSLAAILREHTASRAGRRNADADTDMPGSSTGNNGVVATRARARTTRRRTRLLDLPDDVLRHVLRCLTRPVVGRCRAIPEGDVTGVQIPTLRAALPAAFTCKRMYRLLFGALDNLCLWRPSLEDAQLAALSRNAGLALRRLVLRGCALLTDDGVAALANSAPHLRAVDLSFCSLITDKGVEAVGRAASTALQKLLVRKCDQLGDPACAAIARCTALEVLDVSYCGLMTDDGVGKMVRGCGRTLKMLSLSHCTALTDSTLASIGEHCTSLTQLCARSLPRVTDVGFAALCAGIGHSAEGVDVLDCLSLTRDAVVRALRAHCTHIADTLERDTEWKTLEQVLVTTLRANIFIVHGCDPKNSRPTIHMVLVDNGDIVSANILSASTTDLSLLGVVLCKSYGNAFDESTKRRLTRRYGILPSMLAE